MRRDPPSRCSLLVRNLAKDCREHDLRYHSEKYGPVRDVYLPRDYYTREPRGIAFVEYTNARDAEDAKHALDRKEILGREVSVVFAMQGRKRPDDYRRGRAYQGGGGGGGSGRDRYRRRSLSRSPERRRRSRSISPRRQRSYSRSPVHARRRRSPSRSPPRRRSYTRSRSPRRSYSLSPPARRQSYSRSRSPPKRSPHRERRSVSPGEGGAMERSPSERRDVGSPTDDPVHRSGSPHA